MERKISTAVAVVALMVAVVWVGLYVAQVASAVAYAMPH